MICRLDDQLNSSAWPESDECLIVRHKSIRCLASHWWNVALDSSRLIANIDPNAQKLSFMWQRLLWKRIDSSVWVLAKWMLEWYRIDYLTLDVDRVCLVEVNLRNKRKRCQSGREHWNHHKLTECKVLIQIIRNGVIGHFPCNAHTSADVMQQSDARLQARVFVQRGQHLEKGKTELKSKDMRKKTIAFD